MPENTKEVTSDCFDDFFWYAVDNLPDNTHYSLILLGSGAMVLAGENAYSSYDYDMLSYSRTELLPDDLVELIELYAEQNGYGYDWINDKVGIYVCIDSYTQSSYEVEETRYYENVEKNTKIDIEIPTVETVVYKKVIANRDKDLEQVLPWFDEHGYYKISDIFDFMYNINPYLKYAAPDTPWCSKIKPRLIEAYETRNEL